MKKIWQYGRTGGIELAVSNDFTIQVPFTDTPPLEGIALADQFYIPSENRWKEIVNQLDQEKLDNLSALAPLLEEENKVLKETISKQASQLTDTQMAIAEVYELLIDGGIV